MDCEIALIWYPFDHFPCNFTFKSTLPISKLTLQWKIQDSQRFLSTESEELNDLQKMGWTLDKPERYHEIMTLKDIQYSVLVYKLTFRRQSDFLVTPRFSFKLPDVAFLSENLKKSKYRKKCQIV